MRITYRFNPTARELYFYRLGLPCGAAVLHRETWRGLIRFKPVQSQKTDPDDAANEMIDQANKGK